MNITLPRATVEQALEILESDFTTEDGVFCRWCDSRFNADHHCHLEQVIENLRAALAQQRLTDAQQEMERSIESLKAALAQQAEPVEPVGTFLVTGNEFCGAPPAPYATWGDALASMFAAGTIQGLRISALAQQAEPVCKCDLRTRLVGDGCEVCNPKLAAELAQQAEPVEPVAWAFRHSDGTYHDPSVTEHSAGMVPLYTAPPQRKPLTEEEIDALPWNGSPRQFARAVERARAQQPDPQVADRLARHGIPMPGDPK